MRRSRRLLAPCCALAMFAAAAPAAELPITVRATPGVLGKRPVVVRWERIADAIKGAPVRLSSLRLLASGTPVPFQVDHRDRNGDFLPPGNLTLDAQDELVFVCPTGHQTKLRLHVSEDPKPPVAFPSEVEATLVRQGAGRVHWRLSSGGLKIGIQGAGALDPNAHTPINHGRGSVVELSWQGRSAIWPSMNWAVYMNGHPYAIERWRSARLIVDGPVRKVVAVTGVGGEVKDKDGVVVRKTDVTRYFSMFADVPLYDIEDVVHCAKAPAAWTITYTDRFFAGRARDANDVLWDGSTGAVRSFVLADKNIDVDHAGGLADNNAVAAGWCAWYDTEEDSGLAVFYGPVDATTVRFESGWERYSSVNRMSFVYDGLTAPTTLRHRFRIVGLVQVDGEQVAAEHDLWADDAGAHVTIGRAERSH